ncbi:MAG TPA: ATPase domain-containing protein [Thermoplasmata archaeon]
MQAIPTHVEGLDRALGGGVPDGNIVLVAGGPGTMKSTLVYSILHGNAQNGIPGLFVSLEQDAQDVVEKMALLGMEPLPEDRLYVMDMTHLRLAFRDKEKGKDWIKILSNLFEEAVHAGGYKLFALDSLEVLYAIVNFKEVRRELFHFVGMLKELGFTPFLVAETPLGQPVREGRPEDFLADGIILLEQFPVGAMGVQLRVRCVKMRGSRHDRGYFLLDWDGGKFTATKAIQQ